MTDPVATPSDVRLEIETDLDDDEIAPLIERFSRDIYRQYDAEDMDNQDRQDLEAIYTAYRIVTSHDRAESSISSGRSSIDYEGSLVSELKSRIRRIEPDDELIGGTVIRNTDRHVRSTVDHDV